MSELSMSQRILQLLLHKPATINEVITAIVAEAELEEFYEALSVLCISHKESHFAQMIWLTRDTTSQHMVLHVEPQAEVVGGYVAMNEFGHRIFLPRLNARRFMDAMIGLRDDGKSPEEAMEIMFEEFPELRMLAKQYWLSEVLNMSWPRLS